MGFSEKLQFLIDVDGSKAISGFKNVGDSAKTNLGGIEGHTKGVGGALDGATGKTGLLSGALGKMGLSGGSAAGMIKGAMPEAMMVAAGAVAAFGVKAFGTFQELAGSVLDFQRIVGGTAEASSAFVAVLDDYEISAEAGASAIGKMARAAETTPDKFAKFGIEIAKNKDGTTDLQGTLLNAAEAYQNTGDDATKAALGAAVFGKGYAELIPILEKGSDTADGLAAAFAGVEGQQILSQEQIDSAEETRLAMDALHDSVNEITLALGSALSPVVGDMAKQLTGLTDAANTLLGPIGGLDDALGILTSRAKYTLMPHLALVDGFKALKGGAEEATLGLGFVEDAMAAAVPPTETFGEATDAASQALAFGLTPASTIAESALANEATAAAEAKVAADELAASLKAETEAHTAAAAAITAQVTAMRSAADTSFAVRAATDTYRDGLEELNDKVKEVTDSTASEESKMRDIAAIYDQNVQNAAELADKTTALAVEQSLAAGITSTAAEKQDLWNQNMLDSAANASGPVRQAIIDYVASVNQIPPEKVSEIQALIDQGLLDEAKAKLNEASAARDAIIEAEAHTAAAEAALNEVARKRWAQIEADVTPGHAKSSALPSGGRLGGNASAVAGADSRASATGTAAGINVTVNAGLGANGNQIGNEIVRILKDWERSNGPILAR